MLESKGTAMRNNKSSGYIANRRFRSRHQLEGLCGDSDAIPTVGATLNEIKEATERFISYIKSHPELTYLVTDIGCSKKAGYSPTDIAPLFKDIANHTNVYLPKEFREIIEQL